MSDLTPQQAALEALRPTMDALNAIHEAAEQQQATFVPVAKALADLIEQAKAAERERIAQAIEAVRSPSLSAPEIGHLDHAARIARWRPGWLASTDGTAHARVIDAAHLERQRQWSRATFGPGRRTVGVLQHIRKELGEIEEAPTDVREWIDVAILALDGAWRTGAEPQQIIDALVAKQERNEARTWPDWRTMSEDQAIEHVRDGMGGDPS